MMWLVETESDIVVCHLTRRPLRARWAISLQSEPQRKRGLAVCQSVDCHQYFLKVPLSPVLQSHLGRYNVVSARARTRIRPRVCADICATTRTSPPLAPPSLPLPSLPSQYLRMPWRHCPRRGYMCQDQLRELREQWIRVNLCLAWLDPRRLRVGVGAGWRC